MKILGISVKDKKNTQEEKVFNLAKKASKYIKCEDPIREDVVVFDNYVGDGYGIPTKGMKEAVRTMIYGAETRTRYTKRGIQNSKKGSYKKAIVKVSEGDRIDFFANL